MKTDYPMVRVSQRKLLSLHREVGRGRELAEAARRYTIEAFRADGDTDTAARELLDALARYERH